MALVLGKNEDYRKAIEEAETRTGIDGSAIAALIDAEAAKISSGADKGKWKADSYNPGSGAAGLTQFLSGTWIGHARNTSHLLNARGKAAGLIDAGNTVIPGKQAALLKLRFDPLLSIVSAAEYGLDNLRYLEKKGVIPSGIGDDQRARYMYLAHHEGPGGAVGFLGGTKVYTRANLVLQVGAAAADAYIAKVGSANAAYRLWLKEYMDKKIVPSKFRDGAAAPGGAAPAGAAAVADEPDDPPPPAPEWPADGAEVRVVTTDGLRLRKEPEGERIRGLDLGQRVAIVGTAPGGWVDVRFGNEAGFVAEVYLRRPETPARERLFEVVVAEWLRFAKGKSSEEVEPYNSYVHEMWQAIGEDWWGKSEYANGEDVPWSAAFISFVVGRSGPEYDAFAFAASHSVFVNDAIRARVMGNKTKPFWAWRIDEKKPEIGDIVQRNRAGKSFGYDHAEAHANYPSHSDVVCEVRGRVARVIGGNTGGGEGTVAMSEYELDAKGFLLPGQRIIALLKNRADDVKTT